MKQTNLQTIQLTTSQATSSKYICGVVYKNSNHGGLKQIRRFDYMHVPIIDHKGFEYFVCDSTETVIINDTVFIFQTLAEIFEHFKEICQ